MFSDLGLEYLDLYLIHFPISLKFVPFETRRGAIFHWIMNNLKLSLFSMLNNKFYNNLPLPTKLILIWLNTEFTMLWGKALYIIVNGRFFFRKLLEILLIIISFCFSFTLNIYTTDLLCRQNTVLRLVLNWCKDDHVIKIPMIYKPPSKIVLYVHRYPPEWFHDPDAKVFLEGLPK